MLKLINMPNYIRIITGWLLLNISIILLNIFWFWFLGRLNWDAPIIPPDMPINLLGIGWIIGWFSVGSYTFFGLYLQLVLFLVSYALWIWRPNWRWLPLLLGAGILSSPYMTVPYSGLPDAIALFIIFYGILIFIMSSLIKLMKLMKTLFS